MNKEEVQAMLEIGGIAFDAGVERAMEIFDSSKELVETALEFYNDYQEIMEWQNLLKR